METSVDTYFERKYLWFLRWVERFAFVWPYDKEWRKISGRFFYFSLILLTLTSWAIRIYKELSQPHPSFLVIGLNAFIQLFTGITVAIYTIFIASDSQCKIFYDQLKAVHETISDENKKEIIDWYSTISFIISFMGISGNFMCVFSSHLLSTAAPQILNTFYFKNDTLPVALFFAVEYFIDREKYFYILTVIAMTLDCTLKHAYASCDIMYLYGISLLMGFFKIVRMATQLNDIVKPMYCIKIYILTITLPFLGYAALRATDSFEKISMVLSFAAWMSYIFLICLTGQFYIDHSMAIFDKNCSSDWYKFHPKTRTLIQIIIFKSSIPCHINAGPLIQLDNYTLSAIVQNVVKLITLVETMALSGTFN